MSAGRDRKGESRTKLWQRYLAVFDRCGRSIEREIRCDALNGPDHPDCEKAFLENEDCYQRVLCSARWKEALRCMKHKSRESCQIYINRSRRCKASFFEHSISPLFDEHLKQEATIREACEVARMRYLNCVEVMGENFPQCLHRENILRQCSLSKLVPKKLWSAWKKCEKESGSAEAALVCDSELEDIRSSLRTRADTIVRSSGFVKGDMEDWGGADDVLENMTTVIYGSHYNFYFKDYDPRLVLAATHRNKLLNEAKEQENGPSEE
eukprot:TRINITY_DN2517_c0_g1_i1.p1 TRINITY_DN2517_c0_g1~~TRINITY_DN2517_c0_g1_i1.p1  ORF type:complete len:297 (-),score=61.29 TRINITY_DN2517_c0_g1_i1:71-871(-)